MNDQLRHWLLHLALDFAVSLDALAHVLDGDDRQASGLNVKPLHGFSLNEGLGWLTTLAKDGLIVFRQFNEAETIAPSEVLPLEYDPGALRRVSFELTEAGGRAWEEASQPKWWELVDGSGSPVAKDLCEWEWTWFSQNRERVMATIGWYEALQGERVDLSSVKWETHGKFPVKYWKTLSNVHVVSFLSRSDGKRQCWPEPRWFTDWRASRSKWYRAPWNAAPWPPSRADLRPSNRSF